MNREILFRGKRVDNSEWVYGFFSECPCDNGTDIPSIMRIENHSIFIQYPIIPETVGQYTGLTDKNGVKIFEGDILSMHGGCAQMDIPEYDVICKVVYGRKGYGAEIGFTADFPNGMRTSLMFESCLTVVGNVYDNPELLKGEENG